MTISPRMNAAASLVPVVAFTCLLIAPAGAIAEEDAAIFNSQPATFAPDIFGDKQKSDGVLRVLTLDERVGYERENEMVRVPLFFHAAEAIEDPNGYVITPVGGGDPIPYQADDIRRDASGKVARMHAYFLVEDLPAWGRRQYELRMGHNPGADARPLPVAATNDKVTLAGNDIKVTFHTAGQLKGAISAIETKVGKVTLPDGNLGPETKVVRQNSTLTIVRENEINYHANPDGILVKDMKWASGPIFSKLILKVAPKAAPTDVAEYVYMIPKYRSEIVQMELFYPEENESSDTVGANGNALLTGKLVVGDSPADQKIVSVPAGLRRELRSVFGYEHKAVVNEKSGISLIAIPYSEKGGNSGQEPDGRVFFCGSESFQTHNGSYSGGLRVFWGQYRFVFSKATSLDELWNVSCKTFQPLTAVVDEPWATTEDFFNFARQASLEFWKIKNWPHNFETTLVLNYLSDKPYTKMLEGGGTMPDLRSYIPSKELVETTFKKRGGQGPGQLDAYGVTYSLSADVPFSAFVSPSQKLNNSSYMLAKAILFTNDYPTPEGWPNIHNFANTFNMKMGPYLCALWGGLRNNDHDLVQRARDAVTSQNMLATTGDGQRPYDMSVGGSGNTDALYASVTDYFLRVMELTVNEDLMIHPSVYGRYFNSIDVNTDIYQRSFPRDPATKVTSKTSVPTEWRATFLREQQHDHRWEIYGCDPYLGVLGKASDHGKIGITESCYAMQRLIGKPQGWSALMSDVFFPAVMTTLGLANYQPAPRPPLPANVKVSTSGGKNVVTWDAVPDAAGYRVYRAAHMGGPWKWLNSPYLKMTPYKLPSDAQMAQWQAEADADAIAAQAKAKADDTPADTKKGKKAAPKPPKAKAWTKMPEIVVPPIPDTLVKDTSFTDPDGAPGSVYFVTAQDKNGRESRWFPNEPLPAPGK